MSGPLIGGSQKLEERPVMIRQAVVVKHHRRTSQRTYLEPPVLSCFTHQFFLKSKLQVVLFLKNYPLKVHAWRQSFIFLGQFCIIAKVAMIHKKI